MLVAGALACAIATLALEPVHGLVRTRLGDDGTPDAASAVVDRRVWFATNDRAHPEPEWIGNRAQARWDGFFEAPREGDYLFNLVSDDGAKLFLDGALVIDNGGKHAAVGIAEEVPLKQGPHALRLDYVQDGGAATLKLEMRLPSGYHTAGLLPVALLTPEPRGPRGLQRYAAFGTWAFAFAAVAFALRRRVRAVLTHEVFRRHLPLGAAVFVLALGVRLYDLNGAGETCDEWAYVGGGEIYAANLAAGVFDADQWRVNREHPAVGKLLYGAVTFVFGSDPSVPRSLSALLGALTVLVTFAAGSWLAGLEAGAIAGLVLALLPPFIAHGKVAALDTPATFFFTAALAAFLVSQGSGARARWLGAFTILAGLGIATKLSDGLLLPFVLAAFPLLHWREVRRTGELRVPWLLYLLPVTALVPFVATWPWLWRDLGPHLSETLVHWNVRPPELFLGRTWTPPPAAYFLVCFAASTPIVLFFPAIAGLAQAVRRAPSTLVRGLPIEEPSTRAGWVLLVAWFLLPFAWTFSGFRQDGIRYVYAAFPPLAILVGAGTVVLVRELTTWAGRAELAPRVLAIAAGVLGVSLGVADVRVHPYYLDSFNAIVGGAGGAYRTRSFETGWWGEGIDRAIDWLNAEAPAGATWGYRGVVTHTLLGLRPDLVRQESHPEFWIRADLEPGRELIAGYEEAYAVRVEGAPIVMVLRRVRQ